jgi:hypothetical protein
MQTQLLEISSLSKTTGALSDAGKRIWIQVAGRTSQVPANRVLRRETFLVLVWNRRI